MKWDPLTILLTVLTATWSGWMLSFAVGKWVRRQESSTDLPLYRLQQLESKLTQIGEMTTYLYRLQECERRLTQAGDKMSDLADMIQGLPERLRKDFVLRVEWDTTERRRSAREDP